MKRLVSKWFEDLEVTTQDIEKWYATEGKFCSGCIEGKLKEQARKTSTKPMTESIPQSRPGSQTRVTLRNPVCVGCLERVRSGCLGPSLATPQNRRSQILRLERIVGDCMLTSQVKHGHSLLMECSDFER